MDARGDAGGDAEQACGDGGCSRDAARPDTGAGEPSCPAGCTAVSGYPEDVERGCVDRHRLGFVGCDCNAAAAFSQCGRRAADDTLWVFHAGELDAAAGFVPCTTDESDRVTHACEFEDCDVPPLSICSVAATCADRGCDNLEFDAQGCRRAPCESDADCDDDARCVQLACVSDSFCSVTNAGADESCGCAGAALCRAGGACNPVSAVGPRGAWSRLEFVDSNFICLASCRSGCPDCECAQCTGIQTVDSSGAVLTRRMGMTEPRTATLTADDRSELALLVDGPTLRAGLRDGFGCGQHGSDSSTVLRLELPDVTLAQDVTLCPLSSGESEVARLYQLLSAY